MRKFTISAITLTVLAMAAAATLTSQPAGQALARAEGFQTAMPIDQITAAATNLPVQSFDAF